MQFWPRGFILMMVIIMISLFAGAGVYAAYEHGELPWFKPNKGSDNISSVADASSHFAPESDFDQSAAAAAGQSSFSMDGGNVVFVDEQLRGLPMMPQYLTTSAPVKMPAATAEPQPGMGDVDE